MAWLILLLLATLVFGFVMSNRYRIYYYVRGTWYSFLNLDGTKWIVRKLHLERILGGSSSGDYAPGLNEIIFDNDLNEGLLMQNT